MQCNIHKDTPAIGACVGCGKFICKECSMEIKGKYYCHLCISDKVDNPATPTPPNIVVNANGGSANSSSTSGADSRAQIATEVNGTTSTAEVVGGIVLFIVLAILTMVLSN